MTCAAQAAEILGERVRPGETLLDAGCGGGYYLHSLRNRGIGVDIASFTDAMDKQRAKARAAWAGSGDTASENVWFPLR